MVARTRANKRPIAVPANKISRALYHWKRPLSRWLTSTAVMNPARVRANSKELKAGAAMK